MFRHQGKRRTIKHNLRIAMVLSFVAGIVNVAGFLSIKQLTTNVTGHFALFINDVADLEFWKGTIYFLYILSFLVGSFLSGFLIEKFRGEGKLNIFVIPIIIESLILLSVALLGNIVGIQYPDLIACLLLLAMGMQNSYVTKISNAVVRTTHLTGLFTDLGIDLSQLLFPKLYPDKATLRSTIKLRSSIILFFFFGGLAGGFLYSKLDLKLNTLILGAVILLTSLFYDEIRYRFIKAKRRSSTKRRTGNQSV
ncbi:YoaK family protein [Cytophaga aurantiaca]|uniref:YoaK family protein n=1 Tax=Cytophaga aurantiaca TaxID=29530 RepID=UPI0003A377DC|nr:YoaK family protein [Cytophaga aurantiaca]